MSYSINQKIKMDLNCNNWKSYTGKVLCDPPWKVLRYMSWFCCYLSLSYPADTMEVETKIFNSLTWRGPPTSINFSFLKSLNH